MTPEKLLYTEKAHTIGGWGGGASHSDDGRAGGESAALTNATELDLPIAEEE